MRAGSTLQYQLTAHLVEEAGSGKRVGWIEPEHFPELRQRYADYDHWKVLKSHICTEAMVSEFEQGRARGVYVFRDVRDAVVSALAKNARPFERTWVERFVDTCINQYRRWTCLSPMLVSKYEELIGNVPGEVERIARHLGIAIDWSTCERLASEYNVDKQRQRIAAFEQNLPPEQKSAQGPIYDPATLLHMGHIQTGRSGIWTHVLSSEEVAVIEARAGDWLLAHGYPLASEREMAPFRSAG